MEERKKPSREKRYKFGSSEHSNINDTYKLKKRLAGVIDVLMNAYETDLEKLLGPRQVKKAAIPARKKVIAAIKELRLIRFDIQKQREDYESDYE